MPATKKRSKARAEKIAAARQKVTDGLRALAERIGKRGETKATRVNAWIDNGPGCDFSAANEVPVALRNMIAAIRADDDVAYVDAMFFLACSIQSLSNALECYPSTWKGLVEEIHGDDA